MWSVRARHAAPSSWGRAVFPNLPGLSGLAAAFSVPRSQSTVPGAGGESPWALVGMVFPAVGDADQPPRAQIRSRDNHLQWLQLPYPWTFDARRKSRLSTPGPAHASHGSWSGAEG